MKPFIGDTAVLGIIAILLGWWRLRDCGELDCGMHSTSGEVEREKPRIKMVHKITLKDSVFDISNQCKESKNLFNNIELLFYLICDNYWVTFKDYKKNIEDFF